MRVEKSALIGSLVTVIWWGLFDPTIVELALAFAFLVLVPLSLKLAIATPPYSWTQSWLEKFSRYSLPFAIVAVMSLTIEVGVFFGLLAGVWFIFTGGISFFAFLQMLARGVRPAEETVIDVGMLYIGVGGVWFVLSRIGATSILPYSDVIVELTAIHFHYSAFVLPILTGVFGRWLYQQNAKKNKIGKPYTLLAFGIALGPILVAIGLDLGPPLEFYFVSIYVLFVFWLCGWWLLSVTRIRRVAGILVGISAMVMISTMTLSLLYSLGLYMGTTIISIPDMIRWHGALNAFAFSFLALVGWLMISPQRRYEYSQFPISNLRGKGYVGSDVFSRFNWIDREKTCKGLIGESWSVYNHHSFDSTKLNPLIKEFYLDTSQFHMKAEVNWHKGWRTLSRFSYVMTKKMGQIQLPPSQSLIMTGKIIPIDDKLDGRRHVRAWVRKNEQTNEPIFSALYSSHQTKEMTYMNIALPLTRGVMTGVLRSEHDDQNGLILTSKRLEDNRGDEGIYLTFRKITVKTPLQETFHITSNEGGILKAKHQMTCFGLPFLTINYHLYK
ncbi:YndJ family protein [Salipaludibacillus sp. HK11]|uniref:YndJ family protein n=1 Tax=Salipaludibacillus sp. HK11 TaxID=3394320 RepID=UPI0039FC969F